MRHFATITLLIVLVSVGLACNSGSPVERDQDEILSAIRKELEGKGETTPDESRPISWKLDVIRPPSECFTESFISTDLLRGFERLNINPQSESFIHWATRQTDRLAADTVGVEASLPVALYHSRISFSTTDPLALIYIEDHTPLSGFGAFFLMQKHSEDWQVNDTCYIWHS